MNHLELYMEKETLEKIQKCDDLYLKCSVLIRILFRNRNDSAGYPYLNHLKRVSDKMTTWQGQIAGLLHDLVEDIDQVTFDDLLDIGIPQEIIEILKIVTKEKSTKGLAREQKLIQYGKEIDRIIESGNNVAIELKIADITDNYSFERLNLCSLELREWYEKKYPPQIEKLYRVGKIK